MPQPNRLILEIPSNESRASASQRALEITGRLRVISVAERNPRHPIHQAGTPLCAALEADSNR